MQSPEYAAVRQLISQVQERTGLAEGAAPKKRGKFMVFLPCSMHAALETEAKREGLTMDQLVAKLSMQMPSLMNPSS